MANRFPGIKAIASRPDSRTTQVRRRAWRISCTKVVGCPLRPSADASDCRGRRSSARKGRRIAIGARCAMAAKKVVVAGATGLVGNAALRHFGSAAGCRGDGAVAAQAARVVRRPPCADRSHRCRPMRAAPRTNLQGATHLIYAALYEAPNLIDGWRDQQQINTNDRMLRNLMAALEPAAACAQACRAAAGHQGLWRSRPPAHRAGARRPFGNVRAAEFLLGAGEFSARAAEGQGLALQHPAPGPDRRPRHGRRDGSDPAARRLCRDVARAGPRPRLSRRGAAGGQAIDVDLLARAIAWSGESDAARNEAFNVTNGDVFSWENIWPAVADALGMKPGRAVPLSLAQESRNGSRRGTNCGASTTWSRLGLAEFVGLSFQYADYSMRYGQVQPVRPRSSRPSRSTRPASPK